MVNDFWLEKMPQTTITHLSSTGSDHCPLFMKMVSTTIDHTKYFRFLNCWVDNPHLMETVETCWEKEVVGTGMLKFQKKMIRLSNTLSVLSKREFGDIFQMLRMYEEQVHKAEENYINNQSDSNTSILHVINAKYIKFLKLEDTILKQKTQLQWFKEGDTNYKYFHLVIRGRRRKFFIHKVSNENGDWIQGDDNIAQVACEHFKGIFTGEEKLINEHTLECIPRVINQDQNAQLTIEPSMDEPKEVVLSMNPNSAASPDGMNGYFFQKCLHIIKNDLMGVVQAFFSGQMIPKYFSHSCIVLLPKVNNPNKLTEYRPISLSNFTNKIIFKLMSNILRPILPDLISTNESGIVKGRSVSDNVMLAQEIIH
ncbi:uncharacterized protein LOC107004576 [Solanum pennellii]|uniref:Uncharacterized protein LOC107004576 n=1 Tax=Solanum pennellii TaxID=28526 RepID=A0ABM1FKP3_SOLPN|nr:uncharacterized protein LOC107004576 [Solanum pennellii]XP_027768886.1 uncharacterized protein LOC107004576 [Solanum pennellii]